MSSGPWKAVVALTCAVGIGCGSNATIDDDGEGGSGNAGGSGAAGASGGNGNVGNGGACSAFADAAAPETVTLRFVNDSGLPIYIPASCTTPDFDLFPIEGEDGTLYHYDPSCLQTCETLQSQLPVSCRPCAVATYLIEPGEALEIAWDGRRLDGDVDMPGACWASPPASGSCAQLLAALPGEYRVTANGFSACGGDCSCDAQGLCFGEPTGMEAFADPTTFSFPGDTMVDVVFGPCAFPCPG